MRGASTVSLSEYRFEAIEARLISAIESRLADADLLVWSDIHQSNVGRTLPGFAPVVKKPHYLS